MPQRIDSRLARSATTRKGEPRAFELLRSKLDVPPPRPGLVERAGLVDRLSGGHNCRFVSVVAPPGYGKTTGLAQWAARDARRFAWVSLDHRDNDPAVFLTYVAEALNVDGTVEPAVFKALTGAGDSLWAKGLPRLGSALAARHDPLVLVLDDMHELENHDCLDALLALLPHVPQGSQLVLSGRTEARLGLAKLRADGELLELGPAALALNDAEAHALLGEAGLDVTEAEAKALNEHAEGWAAGLYLAALSLDDGSSSLASFGGDDRFVTDYLKSEELARVEPAELEFLLRSAVLDRMSGPLCDAVLERNDSSQMLEQLEHANLFVVALDHQRLWFRYHHLFREMLRAEFERREPELPASLNRRAAAWCEANGEPEAAIEYAAAAGDTDELARLVIAFASPYYRIGLVTTVERWLATFDDSALLERYPAIAVFGVWLHALRARPDVAERWALAVETSQVEGPMPDGSPFEAWAAAVRALLCAKGVEHMKVDAELAVTHLSAASPWRPASVVLRGVAVLLSGDLDRAEAIFEQAAEAAVAGGAVWAGVVARSERALLALERGELVRSGDGARIGALVHRRRALGRVCRDRNPSGGHGESRYRQGARRASSAGTRERTAHAPDDDPCHVVVRGAGSARAREGASGPFGCPRRRGSLPRGGRRHSSTSETRNARGRSGRFTSETIDGRLAVIGVGVHAHCGRASPASSADHPPFVPGDR